MPSWGRNGEASERLVEPHRFQPTPFQIRRQLRKTLEFLTPALLPSPLSFLPSSRPTSERVLAVGTCQFGRSFPRRPFTSSLPASQPAFQRLQRRREEREECAIRKVMGAERQRRKRERAFCGGCPVRPSRTDCLPRCPRGWLERVSNAGRRMIQHQFRFRFSGRQSSHAETKAFRALGSQ